MTSDPTPNGSGTLDALRGAAEGPAERAKRAAARRAADLVEDGMRVGLGTGSTARHLVERLGERAREDGLRLVGVATSEATARLAREAGLRLAELDEVEWLDLTIDGADEFDANLNLIKGAGGALLREKIVATASDRMVVIADASKEVGTLGAFPLPVEVVPFGWRATRALLEEAMSGLDVMGGEARLREAGLGEPYVTDGGNYIVDLRLGRIANPWQTSLVINQIPGAVDNGLFVDMCDAALIGYGDGTVERREAGGLSTGRERVEPADTDNAFTDV